MRLNIYLYTYSFPFPPLQRIETTSPYLLLWYFLYIRYPRFPGLSMDQDLPADCLTYLDDKTVQSMPVADLELEEVTAMALSKYAKDKLISALGNKATNNHIYTGALSAYDYAVREDDAWTKDNQDPSAQHPGHLASLIAHPLRNRPIRKALFDLFSRFQTDW